MLRSTDYPLPAEFELAYSLADTLAFEMNPAETIDPNFTFELLRAATYKGKSSLKTVLKKKTYKALEEQWEEYGFSIETLERSKPGMVIMMLMVKELNRFGVTREGVDLHFHKRALEDGKEVLALETAEFQIDLIASLGEGMENKLITYGLKDIENLQKNFDALIRVWKKGDLAKIDKYFVDDIRKYPQLYAKLQANRNLDWVIKLQDYMNTPETEFVLVGVAHMAGDEGLIALLKERGYTIEQISLSF